jgi:hypothetical protein
MVDRCIGDRSVCFIAGFFLAFDGLAVRAGGIGGRAGVAAGRGVFDDYGTGFGWYRVVAARGSWAASVSEIVGCDGDYFIHLLFHGGCDLRMFWMFQASIWVCVFVFVYLNGAYR